MTAAMDAKETQTTRAIQSRFSALFSERFCLNEPMSRHTSSRLGGPAEMFVTLGSAAGLQAAIGMA